MKFDHSHYVYLSAIEDFGVKRQPYLGIFSDNKERERFMRRKILWLVLLVCIPFFTGCKNYVKSIRKTLKIEHVFSRPASAYGPGSVVMYEKKSGYTGVCLSEWIIEEADIRSYPIAKFGISDSATISFDLNLNAQDRAKIGVGFEDISKIEIALSNGKQMEIITDLKEAFRKIETGTCGNNCRALREEHPKSRFYFIRVVYAYDLEATIKRKNGTTIEGEVPQEVLKVVAAKIGIGFGQDERVDISGEKLYIGFNGTPRTIAPDFIRSSGPDVNIQAPIIDVTELLK
jgi:hypothetical protein